MMKTIMNTTIFLIFIISLVSACPIKEEKNPEEAGFYQGDINLTPLNFANDLGGVATRNLSLKWPNGVVTYHIRGDFSKEEAENINAAMEHIRDETMINGRLCINFVSFSGLDNQTDYIQIENYEGCWSHLGRQTGAQTLSLESPGCVRSKGIPVHELLHALGFEHEQSRPDRDRYVAIINDTIIPDARVQFALYDINSVDTLGFPYDYGSIMHYKKDAFTFNGSDTIVPRAEGVTIGQRVGLSETDIAEIRTYYDCH